jgi:hypothetical protein
MSSIISATNKYIVLNLSSCVNFKFSRLACVVDLYTNLSAKIKKLTGSMCGVSSLHKHNNKDITIIYIVYTLAMGFTFVHESVS